MFDRISTEQANNLKSPLLVFVDEINAPLENGSVYSAFLAPLEDGVYVRAEKIFHIDPCFWLFAGTNKTLSDESENQDSQKSQKWSDFKSRLTLPNIDLSTKAQLENLHRLEIVYIGATIIVNTFPDVRWITRKVLSLFWLFGGIHNLRMRQLVQFVRFFPNIQKGCVSSENIPFDRLDLLEPKWADEMIKSEILKLAKQEMIFGEKHTVDAKKNLELWESTPEGEKIKIEF